MTKNFDVRQKLNCINVTSSQVSTWWIRAFKETVAACLWTSWIKRGWEQRGRERKISIASTNREINNAGLSRMHRAVDRFSINLKKNFLFCRNKKKKNEKIKKSLPSLFYRGYRRKSAGENVAMKISVERFQRLFLFPSFSLILQNLVQMPYFISNLLSIYRGGYLSFVTSIAVQSKVACNVCT